MIAEVLKWYKPEDKLPEIDHPRQMILFYTESCMPYVGTYRDGEFYDFHVFQSKESVSYWAYISDSSKFTPNH